MIRSIKTGWITIIKHVKHIFLADLETDTTVNFPNH